MGALDGQVTVVTGGGSGLGRAIVARFLEEGARVGVLEISKEKSAALQFDFGDDISVTTGDATHYDDNASAVAATVERFGALDCFIANAGLWDFDTGIAKMAPETIGPAFDQLFSVNVKAGLLGARAALNDLRATRGTLLFTLSNAAFYPGGGGALYTATKHALVGLVRQLAWELAPEVRVNGVAPSGMATDLRGPAAFDLESTSYGAQDVDGIMRNWSPLVIAPRPEDYAGHYVLLASRRDGSVVTGSIHACDAGAGVWGRDAAAAINANGRQP